MGVKGFEEGGVEMYKKKMFGLVGKGGYEERKGELEEGVDKGFKERVRE